MKNKKFIAWVLVGSVFIVGLIGSVNYFVDPLWNFTHSNKFNTKQEGFDERQQKTNYIYSHKAQNYDGILLGSSRTTYFNQNDFKNMNTFNYASNSMFPHEYKGYIDFAKKIKGNDLNHIIIGSDFFGTNIPKDVKFESPEFYIQNTTSLFYKYKMLFSIDALKKSISNIKISFNEADEYYDRDNIKHAIKVSEAKRLKRYTVNIKRHTLELIGPNYIYNNEYIKYLKQIKQENPDTKFIIFTSAVTADLLVSIIKNANRINEYERWLRELVEVFGEVHHFMTINSITKNLQNYPDDDHAYPSILKLIANKISNHENKNIPKDFGILIKKENIDQHLETLKKQIHNYDLNLTLD